MKHSLSVKDFITVSTFFNVIYILLMYSISLGTQEGLLTHELAIVSGIILSFVFNMFFLLVNWYPEVLFSRVGNRRVKDKKVDVKSEVKKIEPVEEIKHVNDKDTMSLVGIVNNPYINANAKRRTLKLTDEEDDHSLYNIKDFVFKLEFAPAGLVYGSTGAGKSSLVFSLLNQLKQSQYQPRFLIADFGGMDWPESEFKDAKQILELFDWLRIINRGRQLEGAMDTRIIVLLEEMQMFLSFLKLEDRKNKTKTYEEFVLTTSQIAMTSRKTGAAHIIGVLQNPKADIIPTELRENLPMVFGLRSSKNLASKVMACPPEIAKGMPSLQPGLTYSHLTDTFFEYPKISKPELPQIRKNELYRLKEYYVKKFGDRVLAGEEQ